MYFSYKQYSQHVFALRWCTEATVLTGILCNWFSPGNCSTLLQNRRSREARRSCFILRDKPKNCSTMTWDIQKLGITVSCFWPGNINGMSHLQCLDSCIHTNTHACTHTRRKKEEQGLRFTSSVQAATLLLHLCAHILSISCNVQVFMYSWVCV